MKIYLYILLFIAYLFYVLLAFISLQVIENNKKSKFNLKNLIAIRFITLEWNKQWFRKPHQGLISWTFYLCCTNPFKPYVKLLRSFFEAEKFGVECKYLKTHKSSLPGLKFNRQYFHSFYFSCFHVKLRLKNQVENQNSQDILTLPNSC